MKNSERAMILVTVVLMIPLLCGITFPVELLVIGDEGLIRLTLSV